MDGRETPPPEGLEEPDAKRPRIADETDDTIKGGDPPGRRASDVMPSQRVGSSPKPISGPQEEAAMPTSTNSTLPSSSSSSSTKLPRLRSKRTDPQVLEIRRKVQQCCAKNDFATAMETYRQAVQDGIRIEAQTFYFLLNLCDGLDRKLHVGTPKPPPPTITATTTTTTTSTAVSSVENEDTESTNPNQQEQKDQAEPALTTTATAATTIRPVDLETRKKFAFEIKRQMDQRKLPLHEAAYTAMVKILARANELQAADEILQEAERVQQCRVKLRLYSPLLIAYCEQGQLGPALKVWERLSKQDLTLTEREYAAILECCAVHAGDAGVTQKVFTDLSEDVLVPSRDTCLTLVKWFESPFAVQQSTATSASEKNETVENNKDGSSSLLSTITLPSSQVHEEGPIGPVQCPPGNKWVISHGCLVDTQTGTFLDGCLQGEQLKPIQLAQTAWDEMLQMNETIVLQGKLDQDTSQVLGGKKGRKRQMDDHDQQRRAQSWIHFQAFLEQHDNHFDVVMDGANVGYFQQNFSGAPRHVNYYQIDSIVQHFLKEQKKLLLVLHQRHFAQKLMPPQFRPLVESWEKVGVLYKTPHGMDDDWFWMHAALRSGPGTLVVTNDEMRDHRFQMLAPRSFSRWKDRHQVHFCFGGEANESNNYNVNGRNNRNRNNSNRGREVFLTYPDVYSRRIQQVADGYAIPLAKRGDENRFLDGVHVANENAPVEETYLCVRPAPVSENGAD